MTSDPPCIIDIEASGFGRHSYPIEVGYVLPDGRSHCTLIRPAVHWTHWDEGAQRLHSISRQMLLAYGRPVDVVARTLNDDLSGRIVYCDGWGRDYPWLATLFDEARQAPTFRLESVRVLLDEQRLAGVPELQRQALIELGVDRHRASNDARALQLALVRAAAGLRGPGTN